MTPEFEYSAIAVSATVLLVYNCVALTSPRTNLRAMLDVDNIWGRKHVVLGAAAEVTLAIQTLRNSVLVSIFIGTVAFNTMTSTLSSLAVNVAGSPLWLMQLLVAILAAGAFLSFAVCIRCAAHAGYLVGGASFLETTTGHELFAAERSPGSVASTPESSATATASHMLRLVHMQSFHFSLAFRCIYSAFPFLFGAAAGPAALLPCMAAIALFQVYLDYAPLRSSTCTSTSRRRHLPASETVSSSSSNQNNHSFGDHGVIGTTSGSSLKVAVQV